MPPHPRRPVRPEPLGGLVVDGEVHRLERAGDDDAVVAVRALHRDVLVPHVVEHGLDVPFEGVAPAAAAAEVVDQLVARLEQMRRDDGGDPDLALGPLADEADVGASRQAPGDARVQVALVHAVLADGGRRARLLDEVAAAAAPELAGPAGVGQVVAAAQDVREEPLVELGRRLDEIAHGRGEGAPAVDAVHTVDPSGADLAPVVEEGLARPGVDAPPTSAAGSRTCRSGARSAPG